MRHDRIILRNAAVIIIILVTATWKFNSAEQIDMNNISINVDEPPLLSDIDDYFDDEAFTSLEPGFGPQIGSPPDVIEPADR